MRIEFYPNNIYNVSFSSRKSEIRKADDIQRKTRVAFPFFSPSYADAYYGSCAPVYHGESAKKCVEHWDNTYRLDRKANKIAIIRENRSEELCGRRSFENLVRETIKDVKKYGLGNCEEAATMVMASIIANGYPNTIKCSLKLDTSVIEKETGEVKYNSRDSLDHALVMSTMDKNPLNQKTFYIIDPWHGFADSVSGAKARYAQLVDKNKFTKAKQKAINNFSNIYKSKYKSFDINNFEIRQKICFDVKECATERDDKNIKKLFEESYPDLILEGGKSSCE